jgi:hypothetical protein
VDFAGGTGARQGFDFEIPEIAAVNPTTDGHGLTRMSEELNSTQRRQAAKAQRTDTNFTPLPGIEIATSAE